MCHEGAVTAGDLPANLRPGAFAGVAEDYVRYRLPYPPSLLDDLVARAAPSESPRLLDLACGAGRVALALAPRFAEVEAVDLEPEMVAVGRREAARLGLAHIRWSVGRAEDFGADAETFDLVSIGEAFHRLDRPRVAGLAFRLLKPGGALVTLGCAGFMDGEAPWRRRLVDLIRSFVGEPARRLGAPNAGLSEEIADERSVLQAAGFEAPASFEFLVEHSWSLAALAGNLRSTSVLSRAALGARHAHFEAALEREMLAYDPGGRYRETVRFGYTLARKTPRGRG